MSKSPNAPPLLWQPFPVHLLPEPVGSYVQQAATAIGCDSAMVATPMLSVLSALIGNRAVISPKASWKEPATVWTAVIGESGSNKSTALNYAVAPLRKLVQELRENYDKALAKFEADHASWEKRTKGKSSPEDPEPTAPILDRLSTSDATIEALVDLLAKNPNGVLMFRDELAGWFKDLCGPYKAKGGSDRETWLSMFRAESIEVDRKMAGSLYVPHAFVAVTGGIQPGILKSHLTPENLESGLASRILFVWPPDAPRRWNENVVSKKCRTDLEILCAGMFLLGTLKQAQLLKLNSAAKSRFVEFMNHLGERTAESSGPLRAAFVKLEAYALRFALIFHMVNLIRGIQADPMAENDGSDHVWEATEEEMGNAIELAEWFIRETQRVYQCLQTGSDLPDLYHLILTKHAGRITARDLGRAKAKYRVSGAAEKALEQLVKSGLAHWAMVPTEGRSAYVCELLVSDGSG